MLWNSSLSGLNIEYVVPQQAQEIRNKEKNKDHEKTRITSPEEWILHISLLSLIIPNGGTRLSVALLSRNLVLESDI